MRKSIIIIILIMVALSIAVFFYLKYHVLETSDFKAQTSERSSPTDIRPEVIAKLKQLVKDGSEGLYVLELDSIFMNAAGGEAGLGAGRIYYDTGVYNKMLSNSQLPDDVFSIKFSGIRVDGLDLKDFIGKKELSLKSVSFLQPDVNAYHHTRSFNAVSGKQKKTLSEKISASYQKISIGDIYLNGGKFTNHNLNKDGVTSSLGDVDIHLGDFLIDSNAARQRERFIFSRESKISAKDYEVQTPAKDYKFHIDKIEITGETKSLLATGISFKPEGGHVALQKRFQKRKVIYDVALPRLSMQNVDWWALFNHDEFFAASGKVSDAIIKVYIDRRKPAPVLPRNNYPHQLLMRLRLPVNIQTLEIASSKVIYEEINPDINQAATVIIDQLNGTIDNITNVKNNISRQSIAALKSHARLKGATPIEININLDLANVKTGKFNASLVVGKIDNDLINHITEPLSLFTIKRGTISKGIFTMSGDNAGGKGKMTLYYEDLHITPLKPDSNSDGELRKKHLTSFIANKFLIKNANPLHGNLRQPEYSITRDPFTGFIKLIWVGNMTGILKTIGVPAAAVYK